MKLLLQLQQMIILIKIIKKALQIILIDNQKNESFLEIIFLILYIMYLVKKFSIFLIFILNNLS